MAPMNARCSGPRRVHSHVHSGLATIAGWLRQNEVTTHLATACRWGSLVGRSCARVQQTATRKKLARERRCEANRQRTCGSRSDPRNCQSANLCHGPRFEGDLKSSRCIAVRVRIPAPAPLVVLYRKSVRLGAWLRKLRNFLHHRAVGPPLIQSSIIDLIAETKPPPAAS